MPDQNPSVLIVIPARLSSQRLPGKMLLHETGKPLIQHTWEAVRQAKKAEQVVVATDHEDIRSTVEAFGGDAVMTSPTAPNGTARIVEALSQFPNAKIIVNVQGDEPELSPEAIDSAIDLLTQCPEAGLATLVTPFRSQHALSDPAAVKAVLTPWRQPSDTGFQDGTAIEGIWRAITFSRASVPAAREWNDDLLDATPPLYWQHIGLYAFRRHILERWESLPESRLAQLESLEQLRAIEAGIPIAVGPIDHAARGIDTQKDYDAFVERWKEHHQPGTGI